MYSRNMPSLLYNGIYFIAFFPYVLQGRENQIVAIKEVVVVIYKVKARDDECKNEQAHHSGGQEGLR